MSKEEIIKIIDCLALECKKLKDKYVKEINLEIDYVCIFSQNENEFAQLIEAAKLLGKVVDETPTGPVFAFDSQPKTIAGSPKLLKIRKPDPTRPQRGDVDFNTNYSNFKNKYLNNKELTLIKRDRFEMIELRDNSFNVLVYFSSIPQSKLLKATENEFSYMDGKNILLIFLAVNIFLLCLHLYHLTSGTTPWDIPLRISGWQIIFYNLLIQSIIYFLYRKFIDNRWFFVYFLIVFLYVTYGVDILVYLGIGSFLFGIFMFKIFKSKRNAFAWVLLIFVSIMSFFIFFLAWLRSLNLQL